MVFPWFVHRMMWLVLVSALCCSTVQAQTPPAAGKAKVDRLVIGPDLTFSRLHASVDYWDA